MKSFDLFLIFMVVCYLNFCLGSSIHTTSDLNNEDVLGESLDSFKDSDEDFYIPKHNQLLPTKRSQKTRFIMLKSKPEQFLDSDSESREHFINIHNAEQALEDSSKLIAALLSKYEKLTESDDLEYSHSKSLNDLNDFKKLFQYKRTFSLNDYLQKKRGYYTRPCLMNVISCYYHGK